MFPYIYTEQNGIHVIDLVQTSYLLKNAVSYVQGAAQKGKTFLFVGTKPQASSIIGKEAQRCQAYYVNHRWLGGTLTNWSTIQPRLEYLKSLDEREESGEIERLAKKEAASLCREREKLRHNLGGLCGMSQIPDVVIVIDPRRESVAIAECRKLQIPIVSILDTNCDPNVVDIQIPANDDAVRSIKLIVSTLADGILFGTRSQAQ
jgi:small subunit ribosomal protein S2